MMEDAAQAVVDLFDQGAHLREEASHLLFAPDLPRGEGLGRPAERVDERIRQSLVHLEPLGRWDGVGRAVHRCVGFGRVERRVGMEKRHDQEERTSRIATLEETARLLFDPRGRVKTLVVRKRIEA